MNGYTALFLKEGNELSVFPGTFGRYRDQFLWNKAWVREHYDLKNIGPEGRTWYGVVNQVGIDQLKALGYSIRPARVISDVR
jgi:hypothetical protein